MFKGRFKKFPRPRQAPVIPGTPLLDYDKYLAGHRGRALLSYLPEPVRAELSGKPENEFSNRGIARSLPRALNELGYVVDVVSWDDASFTTTSEYDLLVQHGGVNFDTLKSLLKPSGKTIYFSSGSYWKYHNSAERKRFADFEKRHGFKPPYDRLITSPEEKANREAAGIIALGNKVINETYKGFRHVYNMNLGCYPDKRSLDSKDYESAKNNFLFVAGGGNIHKGLDLTIEAFLDQPQHLYIMTDIEPKIADTYKNALEQPNIHYVGWVGFRSPKYYEILDNCAYAILPSCSEGQPGSMVECLNQGLVPLITRDVHIDASDFGFTIEPDIQKIRSSVTMAAGLKPIEVAKRSKKAKQVALADHSPELFINNFKRDVRKIANFK